MKLSTREQAKYFADGFTKGREAGIAHAAKAEKSAERRLVYARERIAYLARWRRFAIDRFGLGRLNVAEADRAAKGKGESHG